MDLIWGLPLRERLRERLSLRSRERLRSGVRLVLRPRLRLRYPPFRAGERLAPSLSWERRRSIEGDRECRERDGERDREWSSGESMVAQAARSVGEADCCHGQRARFSCSNGSKQSPARLLNTRRARHLIGPRRSLAPPARFRLGLHHAGSQGLGFVLGTQVWTPPSSERLESQAQGWAAHSTRFCW